MNSKNSENYQNVTLNFYEKHAREYIEKTGQMLDIEWLDAFAGRLSPGGKVLDVGCAGGRDSDWFGRRGFDVYGIDNSPSMIRIAQEHFGSLKLRTMNLLELDFEDQFFDGIWCSCVLLHLAKRDIPKALNEFARVLKKEGLIYVLVKYGEKEGFERDERYGGDLKFGSYFTEEALSEALVSCGFRVLASTSTDKKVDEYRAQNRIFILAEKTN